MPYKQLCLGRLALVGASMGLYFLPVGVNAQEEPTPAPIWSGEGGVPKQYGDRKVFLSPDQHTVILVFTGPEGTQSTRVQRYLLHNVIFPDVHLRVEESYGEFIYRYDLSNGKQSEDPITTFSVVVYPDPNLTVSAESWKGGKSIAIARKRVSVFPTPDWTFPAELCSC